MVAAHWVELFCFLVSASKTLKVTGPQGIGHHVPPQLAEEVPASWTGGLKADPQEKPVVKELFGVRGFKLALAQHKNINVILKALTTAQVCVCEKAWVS